MSEILIFSKTNWDEVPRLRHQTANLLKRFNRSIYFFQKPSFPWCSREPSKPVKIADNFHIARTEQLIHHQLRLTKSLMAINSYFEKIAIKSVVKSFSQNPIIINFNYDYFFLREIFPGSKIITILNDDFVAQARFFDGKPILKALEKTCSISDDVLVVSYPIFNQVKNFCNPVLFLPWSDTGYKNPSPQNKRFKTLLWAHIDGRIDFELISAAAKKMPDVVFDLVGPVSNNVSARLEKICTENSNIIYSPPRDLNDIDFDTYFCSIIPYKCGIADIEAVTISNKTFQLLARGMPIATHGMPNFYDHPAIIKSNTLESFVSGLTSLREKFVDLQIDIEKLILINGPDSRLKFLSNLLFQ